MFLEWQKKDTTLQTKAYHASLYLLNYIWKITFTVNCNNIYHCLKLYTLKYHYSSDCYNMFSTCHVSAWINIMQQVNGIMQDNPFSFEKRKHLWRHITAIQTVLIFLASRWEFGIIEFWEARCTSYPAHFSVLSKAGVISLISWMNASAPDAKALPHICVQQRGSPSLSWGLLIWVLDVGHSFMRRHTISDPYISPRRLDVGFWLSDEIWAKSAAELSTATKAKAYF